MASVHLQQEGDHALGDGAGGVAGHVAHGDIQSPGGLHVHHVVACSQDADHLERCSPLERVTVQLHLVEDGDLRLRQPPPSGPTA